MFRGKDAAPVRTLGPGAHPPVAGSGARSQRGAAPPSPPPGLAHPRGSAPGWGSVAPPGLAAGLPRWTAPSALMFRGKDAAPVRTLGPGAHPPFVGWGAR
ncbi:MAG: hypothetical protein NTZ50_15215, partial [Chloroflexi bacterium]|nr:hypothetical protein [Chloroflexota bacterium]